MLKGKNHGIKTNGSKFVKLYYNDEGSPVRRVKPKERMSKKERRKKRQEEKENG